MVVTLATRIFLLALPVIFMIAIIPYVRNDFLLAAVYVLIIAISAIRYSRKDVAFLAFGFCALFVAEYFFILTGVEVFERRSLLGIMPVWLPLLWAYVFVCIKRSVVLFDKYL